MRWTDISDIAIELFEAHPGVDPLTLNFVDLRSWVLALPEFDDDPDHCDVRAPAPIGDIKIPKKDPAEDPENEDSISR